MRARDDPIERGVVEHARDLRSHPAAAERTAWRLLRNRRMLGLKFRRQHPLKGLIVDFYCAEQRLVLEIDGGVHDRPAQAEYDRARTTWLEGHGLRVLRIRSRDVSRARLEQLLRHELALRPPSPHRGEGDRG